MKAASDLLEECRQRNWTLTVAESLTGGLLSAAVVDVPGASTVFRGGVTTYQLSTKTAILGVDEAELARTGAVTASVAAQMVRGVSALFRADMAISTTGVAGPDADGDHPVGQVFIAVKTPEQVVVSEHYFSGERTQIRAETVRVALEIARKLASE
ncbi:MAG: CinA family protein [Actinomycetaceae bacterium]|nr:CinA family protein [Actinomycetaceae bacterium]